MDGGDFMRKLIPDYDSKTGRQHNFMALAKVAETFFADHVSEQDWVEHWAKILTLDTVIGNTDRHHDNWGIIFTGHKPLVPYFAPAFDNGTSTGHEIVEKNFVKFTDNDYLKRYVSRGSHHMQWDLAEVKKCNHVEFMIRFLHEYPEQKTTVLKCLDFTGAQVNKLFEDLLLFPAKVRLSRQRAEFMDKLIRFRRDLFYDAIVKL